MAALEPPPRETRRQSLARSLCTLFASLGFLVMVIGITYFALLVASVHFGDPETTARAYREIGLYLSGQQEWYRDARVYGASSLLCALVSLLFGVHPFARITIPVAGLAYLVLHLFGHEVFEAIRKFAVDP
ncbi:MAG: hypothetical protein ACYS0E_03430 [Planctomycetota bacterium]